MKPVTETGFIFVGSVNLIEKIVKMRWIKWQLYPLRFFVALCWRITDYWGIDN